MTLLLLLLLLLPAVTVLVTLLMPVPAAGALSLLPSPPLMRLCFGMFFPGDIMLAPLTVEGRSLIVPPLPPMGIPPCG